MKGLLFYLCTFISSYSIAQNVGIGTTSPAATLEVRRGTAPDGTAAFYGTNNISHFNYGTTEDTYIRGGKSTSHVILNDNGSGFVGIGTIAPGFPLNFPDALGDKIALFGNTGAHYGFGIQNNLLQIHSDAVGSAIAFGYGSSTTFTEIMRIKGNGNVGIGNSNPVYPLDVVGNAATAARFVNTAIVGNYSSGIYGSCYNTAGVGIGVEAYGGYVGVESHAEMFGGGPRAGVRGYAGNGSSSGNVYGVFGTANAGANAYGIYGYAWAGAINYAGYFQGDVYTTGTYQPSDRKLKNDIKSLSGALSIINQLNPSMYTYKTDEYKHMQLSEGIHYGLIADEVQKVMPGIVKKAVQPAEYENHDERTGKKLSEQIEFNAVNYTELIPIRIGGMKEQQVIISNQNKKIDQQQQQINDLSKEMQLIKEKMK